MHHTDVMDDLPELLDIAGVGIGWSSRHGAMVARCEELRRISEAAGSPATVALWSDRLRTTEQWRE